MRSFRTRRFSRGSKKQHFGRGSYCKRCHAIEVRERKYGVSHVTMQDILYAQGNRCAICKRKRESDNGREWAVDHDHETGAIRGILCANCNGGLGMFQDSVVVLRGAIDYLERADACASEPPVRLNVKSTPDGRAVLVGARCSEGDRP